MGESTLRVKFGEHEFEAEGPSDSVERQFLAFRLLISPSEPPPAQEQAKPQNVEKKPAELLERIMKVNGPIVSLTVRTNNVDDAVLALMFGHRQLRNAQLVSGAQIMQGLRASGFDVLRADVILRKQSRRGHVAASGRYRNIRYQLSLSGYDRAWQIVRQWAAQAPAE